jgi:ubiquinone/menaquinone biosynthesis C-methylase UbiE
VVAPWEPEGIRQIVTLESGGKEPSAAIDRRVKLSVGEAIRVLRQDPACEQLIIDSYLEEDIAGAAQRFVTSAEWTSVMDLVGRNVVGRTVLDLGAGTGIATYALRASGASYVIALEPDPSEVVGYSALKRLVGKDSGVAVVASIGESIPLDTESIDLIYVRQVLHHIHDLDSLMRECYRVLRPGGAFLATREHVVDNENQLREFLATHAIHRLAGGENAHSLTRYERSIRQSGLKLEETIGPWDSVINAFPAVRTPAELEQYPVELLKNRFGAPGTFLARVPGANALTWKRIRRPKPGRLYSFLARR